MLFLFSPSKKLLLKKTLNFFISLLLAALIGWPCIGFWLNWFKVLAQDSWLNVFSVLGSSIFDVWAIAGIVIAGLFSKKIYKEITRIGAFCGAVLICAYSVTGIVKHQVVSWRMAKAEAAQPNFSVITANVHYSNVISEKFKDYFFKQSSDVIVLDEISYGNYALIEESLKSMGYFFYKSLPSHDAFGIAVFSKRPILDLKIIPLGCDIDSAKCDTALRVPSIYFKTKSAEGVTVGIQAVHVLPPISSKHLLARDTGIGQALKLAAFEKGPHVIAGDLNTVPWDPVFEGWNVGNLKLVNQSNSWPNFFYKIAGIAIDQVIVNEQVQLINSKIGEDIGSDHYPVKVNLHLSAKSADVNNL